LTVRLYDCKVHWTDCSWLVHRSVIVRTPLLMYFGRRTPFHSEFILTIEFILQIAVHKWCREASVKSDELSVNEFSFLTKLLTVTVCRKSVPIPTTLELLLTALTCRIIIKLLHIGSMEPDQSLLSSNCSLIGWRLQVLNGEFSSEAFFHKLLIIYSQAIFHAI